MCQQLRFGALPSVCLTRLLLGICLADVCLVSVAPAISNPSPDVCLARMNACLLSGWLACSARSVQASRSRGVCTHAHPLPRPHERLHLSPAHTSLQECLVVTCGNVPGPTSAKCECCVEKVCGA